MHISDDFVPNYISVHTTHFNLCSFPMFICIGSGKTFVAAEFVLLGLKNRGYPDTRDCTSSKEESKDEEEKATNPSNALFLVPTCDLVTQQKRAIEYWVGTDYEVAGYFGGQAVPVTTFDVLVSTPQAFQTLQQTETKSTFSWSNFFAVVFDEVHHVLKDHPYRIIAHDIKAWEKNKKQRIQVVGLSASLTYAVEHKAVEQALASLCHDLSVTKMISPSEEELKQAGYIPQDDSIETMKKPWDVPDVVIPEGQRLPHLMHEQFFTRVESKTTTIFAAKIYKVVMAIEAEVIACESKNDGNIFKSPLGQIKLSTWEDYAHKMKSRSRTGSALQMLYGYLETWYVALRMVVQSWEEEQQLVLQWLIINEGFHIEGWFSPQLEAS